MSTTSAIEIGSDRWNAQVYAGLSKASELVADLDRPGSSPISASYNERDLTLLDDLNEFLTKVLAAIDKSESLPLSTVTTKEKYLSAHDATLKLYEICQRLLSLQGEIDGPEKLHRKLESLRTQSERLLDVADWLDAMSTPDEINAKINSGLAEIANDDLVRLNDIR